MSRILDLVHSHTNWRNESINLLPSENILSPAVLEALGSDLSSRYSLEIHDIVHGEYVENAYRGTKFSEEIIHHAGKLACEVFDSKFAVTDALSGHIAGMIALLSSLKKGDLMLTTPIEFGGYDGYTPGYYPEMFGFNADFLPFDPDVWNLSDEAPGVIRKTKPRGVVIGTSYILFPYDLKPLREACDEAGSRLLFDASHVLGLIAGGEFQPDAMKYCDIVYGSTHKTFFGPQGGLLLTNDEDLFSEMRKNLTWRTIDNPHLNRIAGLGIALEEMKMWGKEYASRVVRNSQALGRQLYDLDVPIKYPPMFSRSHQLHLDSGLLKEKFGLSMNDFGKKLEENYLITDAVGRLGTAEITRIGMKEKDMTTLAGFIHRAIQGSDGDGGGDNVGGPGGGRGGYGGGERGLAREVREFRARFGLEFTLDRE